MIYQSNFLGCREPPSEVDGEQFKILSVWNEVKLTHLINLNNTIYNKLETSLRKGLLTWQAKTQILITFDGRLDYLQVFPQ